MEQSRLAVRSGEYWDWVAVALFLLLTVDMLTTVFAAVAVGVHAESNPLVRWALREGVAALAALNLVALVVTVALFYGLRSVVARTTPPRGWFVAAVAECWLAALVAAGLALFANNLVVIVFGVSLF